MTKLPKHLLKQKEVVILQEMTDHRLEEVDHLGEVQVALVVAALQAVDQRHLRRLRIRKNLQTQKVVVRVVVEQVVLENQKALVVAMEQKNVIRCFSRSR